MLSASRTAKALSRAAAVAMLAATLAAPPAAAQADGSAIAHPTPAELAAWRDETVRFLADLIRIDTSNPPGNETRAAEYLQRVLAAEGIQSEIIESAPGRGNLIARLRGNGSKRPLILMAHLDVVGVEREQWSVDPFAAEIRDGYLYGRGARDDKGMLAANLEVFLQLHRRRVSLDRDIIFLAEAGEEGTPQFGIIHLIENHWDKIDAEFALNEGGLFHETNGRLEYAGVGTAEKVPRGLSVIVRGSAGHGSVPRPDNAIARLAAALAKITAWQPPMRLNETTRAYFERLAAISPPEDARLYRNLDDPAVQETIRRTRLFQNAVLRTTITPTIIQGGFRNNVIPTEARAELDVRILPDENMDEFIATLRRLVDDPGVEIVSNGYGRLRPTAPPSSIQSDMFLALERAQRRVFPEAITLPMMPSGATDSGPLRARGVQAYGIGIPIDDADQSTVHGNNERVSIAALGRFLEFLYAAVTDVAASRP